MKVRKPAVAGAFYAGTKAELSKQITECFTGPLGPGQVPKPVEHGPRKILGIVSPHAGYIYSGPIAAHGYSRLASDGLPETFVILGPNHTGYGSGVSIMTEGSWETPLGQLPIDNTLAKKIQKAAGIIDINEEAHAFEHSIEVQLPFIQFLYGDTAKFVPICMMMQDLRTSREIAKAIVEQLKERDVFIVASSDFTHYEPHEIANRKDRTAIDAITRLDEAALNELGETGKVTMCGYGPITVLMAAGNLLGGVKAELLTHKTSGDATGDKSAVVGYTSLIVQRE